MKRVPSGSTAQGAAPSHRSSYTSSPSGRRRTGPCWPAGLAERDRGGDDHAVRDAEQRAQLVLDELVPGGHHAAVAEGAGGEQQVLAGRVDAGALGGGRVAVADEAREHHDRRLLEVVDEVLHRARHARLRRRRRRRRSPRRSGRGRPSPATSRGTRARAAPWPRRADGPSRSTRNRNGCRFEPDGARVACHRIVARSSSGIGSSV